MPAGTDWRLVILRVLRSKEPISEAKVSDKATEILDIAAKYIHSSPGLKKLKIATNETAPPFARTLRHPLRPSFASSKESAFFSSIFHLVATEPVTRKINSATNQVQ